MSERPYLLRLQEAAEFLSISQSKLRLLIKAGLIPVVQLGEGPGSAVGIRVQDLREYADSRIACLNSNG